MSRRHNIFQMPAVPVDQHPLLTADLDYDLPERCIATVPAEPRDAARLLVVHRSNDSIQHASVRDLPDLLKPRDLLIMNDTAVLPARLMGRKRSSGGRIEGLFLSELQPSINRPYWRVMLKGRGRLRPGMNVDLLDALDHPTPFSLHLESHDADAWLASVESSAEPAAPTAEVLHLVGRTPLPPYILHARGKQSIPDEFDRLSYQTVYADASHRQSVAAPTAGLHFTPDLLNRLDLAGIRRAAITLHVGPGTFKPITADRVADHHMHEEFFSISAQTLDAIASCQAGSPPGRRIAVGTTTVRTLESLPAQRPTPAQPISSSTRLLITPGHQFRRVDGLLTNFHLPRSTLLALVAAFLGLDRVKSIYRLAIDHGYRFYSYGDAMLILP